MAPQLNRIQTLHWLHEWQVATSLPNVVLKDTPVSPIDWNCKNQLVRLESHVYFPHQQKFKLGEWSEGMQPETSLLHIILTKKKSHCNTRLPSMSWGQVIRAPISLVYLELLWTWDSLESTKAFQRHLEEVEKTILRPLKSSLIFIQENDLKHQKNATIPQDYEFVSKQTF